MEKCLASMRRTVGAPASLCLTLMEHILGFWLDGWLDLWASVGIGGVDVRGHALLRTLGGRQDCGRRLPNCWAAETRSDHVEVDDVVRWYRVHVR